MLALLKTDSREALLCSPKRVLMFTVLMITEAQQGGPNDATHLCFKGKATAALVC